MVVVIETTLPNWSATTRCVVPWRSFSAQHEDELERAQQNEHSDRRTRRRPQQKAGCVPQRTASRTGSTTAECLYGAKRNEVNAG